MLAVNMQQKNKCKLKVWQYCSGLECVVSHSYDISLCISSIFVCTNFERLLKKSTVEESNWTQGVLSKRVLYCQLNSSTKVQWSARLEVLPGSLLKSEQSEVLKSTIYLDKTRTAVNRPEVKPNRQEPHS